MLVRELRRREQDFLTHQRPIPELRREADILFRAAKLAVFVDGCFWHGCPEHFDAVSAASSTTDRVATAQVRDADTDLWLHAAGWRTVRVWEHTDPAEAADIVEAALTGL